MSLGLRPLQLPLLVEQRRKQEEEAAAVALIAAGEMTEGDVTSTCQHQHNWQQRQTHQHPLTMADPTSPDVMSPVTPTFSARGHLRYSSSMSSFELATPV